jgi:uncharacterized membrane protein
MKKHLGIFMRGVAALVPAAFTLWALIWVGVTLQAWAVAGIGLFWKDAWLPAGTGVVMIVVAVYLVGLLMHLWVFRRFWNWLESMLARLPGVKIIFESVRDLMKLFGGGAGSMGRAVEYRPPGAQISVLGIVTNENPPGAKAGEPRRVAVYIPLAYMFGGPTVLAPPEHLRELDMPVEQALKLAATAMVGGPVAAKPDGRSKS